MRISETVVVQLVGSDPPQLVIHNDNTGAEISLLLQDVDYMLKAVDYSYPYLRELEHYE